MRSRAPRCLLPDSHLQEGRSSCTASIDFCIVCSQHHLKWSISPAGSVCTKLREDEGSNTCSFSVAGLWFDGLWCLMQHQTQAESPHDLGKLNLDTALVGFAALFYFSQMCGTLNGIGIKIQRRDMGRCCPLWLLFRQAVRGAGTHSRQDVSKWLQTPSGRVGWRQKVQKKQQEETTSTKGGSRGRGEL